jgi:hypothetical protein
MEPVFNDSIFENQESKALMDGQVTKHLLSLKNDHCK